MHRSKLLAFAAASTFATTAVQAQTFIDDDFETNTSTDYTIVNDGTPDGTQMFAWDYSTAGIPLAPRSQPGETRGLRLTANDAPGQASGSTGATDAWTCFHNNSITADRYKLTVDVYINFQQGSFTTEHVTMGVGGDGTTFNQYALPTSGSGAFMTFTGDEGSASDYRFFRDAANTPMGETDSGPLPGSHPAYLAGSANGSAVFYQNLFPSPPSTVAGSPGNIWTTVEIVVDNIGGVIEVYFDGTLTIQANFAGDFNGFASLGHTDIFTSVSGSLDVYVVYDNFVVEEITGNLGSVYCNSTANSTGNIGGMNVTGLQLASANNVTLNATDLPQNSFGFFITSQTQATVMMPGGSQGILCIGGNIGRYVGAGQIQNSGSLGAFSLALDLTQTPTPTGLVTVNAGETWNFQGWYRDSIGGTATSNFTDAVAVPFN